MRPLFKSNGCSIRISIFVGTLGQMLWLCKKHHIIVVIDMNICSRQKWYSKLWVHVLSGVVVCESEDFDTGIGDFEPGVKNISVGFYEFAVGDCGFEAVFKDDCKITSEERRSAVDKGCVEVDGAEVAESFSLEFFVFVGFKAGEGNWWDLDGFGEGVDAGPREG